MSNKEVQSRFPRQSDKLPANSNNVADRQWIVEDKGLRQSLLRPLFRDRGDLRRRSGWPTTGAMLAERNIEESHRKDVLKGL